MITAVTELPSPRPPRARSRTTSPPACAPPLPTCRGCPTHGCRPRKGAHGYLAVLDFEDDAAFTAYTSSAAFRAAHADPTHSLADDNRVMVFEAVTQV